MEIRENIVNELKKIVGTEYVSTARADLYIYSQDLTEHEPSQPDLVVMPDSVEEVQDVLRLANREKIPVMPYTAGLNVGGLTWIGTMGPTSQWPEALEKIFPVFDKYRLLRIVSIGPFRGAHYGMLRSIVSYNKNDPDKAERVKHCMREVLLVALDTGFKGQRFVVRLSPVYNTKRK